MSTDLGRVLAVEHQSNSSNLLVHNRNLLGQVQPSKMATSVPFCWVVHTLGQLAGSWYIATYIPFCVSTDQTHVAVTDRTCMVVTDEIKLKWQVAN